MQPGTLYVIKTLYLESGKYKMFSKLQIFCETSANVPQNEEAEAEQKSL